MDAKSYVESLARAARQGAGVLAVSKGAAREAALRAGAAALRKNRAGIAAANEKDLAAARQAGLAPALIDRLRLSEESVESLAGALEQIAAQPDPVGATLAAWNRPDGLRVEKRRVPIGVIGVIYESRPNVTAEAGGLALKSGNAAILRGGKEALHSNLAVGAALREGLAAAGLPQEALAVIDRTDHEVVTALCQAEGLIDLLIPRGGEGLIRAVVAAARIPVIKHYTGNCHVYIHEGANLGMAERIVLNAKCQRPGICNAAETLLVDAAVAETFLPAVAAQLAAAGVELRGCPRSRELLAAAGRADPAKPPIAMKPAAEDDWYREYLDLVLAVRVVEGPEAAIDHINAYGSHHTDAIVTGSLSAAEAFTARVDSASVMVNASTRLADGGVYGLGAEVGISTDKLHARGPMGAEDLTTYKWIVTGQGHLRK